MQINTNAKQFDFQEYKLILDPTELSGTESDKELVVKVIEKIAKDLKLNFVQSEEKPKQRTVWYLDTDEHDFYKKNNFTVRIKQKEKDNGKLEYDVTFKIRTPEKDKTLTNDLEPITPQDEFKIEGEANTYEEDIISKGGSQFSLSTELEFKKDKYESRFNDATCADVLSIFPKLKLDVLENKVLSNVNGIKVQETSYEIGDLLFEDLTKAKIEFSIWCMLDDSKNPTEIVPVIGEFDIDVSLKNLSTDNDQSKSSESSIKEIEALYKKMQSESIVDINGTTKTEFIYNYNKRNQIG
jgi:hypothetical protein